VRVLITGATGFIGSHLTRSLVQHGYEVYALVRPNADLWRIADVAHSIQIVRGDLGSLERLVPFLREVRARACFHLGWYPVVPGQYLMAPENLEMLQTSIQLARYVTDAGCEVLVGAGTCLEYDTEFGNLSESTPSKPQSLYAATKLALGLALTHWATVSGLRVVWARLFQEFGPYEDARRLVPLVIGSLLGNRRFRPLGGSQVRDYLPVEDVAEALRLLMESDVRGPVNVGSGMPIAVLELARKIGAALGRADLIDAEDGSDNIPGPAFICANSRYLQTQTRWRPRISLEQGLARSIEWWKGQLREAPPSLR